MLVTQLGQLFPQAPQITFASWMMFAFPLALAFTLLTWFLLSKILFPLPATTPFSGKDYIQGEIRALSPMGNEEKKVAWVFLAASCGFMLPVSTPPNAIAYGSGRVPVMKMVWAMPDWARR